MLKLGKRPTPGWMIIWPHYIPSALPGEGCIGPIILTAGTMENRQEIHGPLPVSCFSYSYQQTIQANLKVQVVPIQTRFKMFQILPGPVFEHKKVQSCDEFFQLNLEVLGIEPWISAWEAEALPLLLWSLLPSRLEVFPPSFDYNSWLDFALLRRRLFPHALRWRSLTAFTTVSLFRTGIDL